MSKENKALEGALLITNPKDLSLRSGEEVFHLDIRLTVAQKHGEVFGDLRPIELGLWTPEHRTALAAVLIYCWEKCMRTRLMRDSIRSCSSLDPSDKSLGYSQASAMRTQKITRDPGRPFNADLEFLNTYEFLQRTG
jgi:hypothetical protein